MFFQVLAAVRACKKEFVKLYTCVYKSHMLYLWLWHPEYSRSAARALATTLNLVGSAAPDPNDKKDVYMFNLFQDDRNVVRQLWKQYHMTQDEVNDIVSMSHTDNSGKRQKDLAAVYPHYDYFLFIKYAALCTANHYIEGSFSNEKTSYRINMSDERLDRDVRCKQNILHQIKKEVVRQAQQRMARKGCKTKTR